MKTKLNKMIRLYCSQKLSLNKTIILTKNDTHYLKNVMRCKENDQINLFNENDKEFFSKILKIQKDETTLKIFEHSKKTTPRLQPIITNSKICRTEGIRISDAVYFS